MGGKCPSGRLLTLLGACWASALSSGPDKAHTARSSPSIPPSMPCSLILGRLTWAKNAFGIQGKRRRAALRPSLGASFFFKMGMITAFHPAGQGSNEIVYLEQVARRSLPALLRGRHIHSQ